MFDLQAHETANDTDANWFASGSEALNHGELWRVAVEDRGRAGRGRVLMKRQGLPALVAAYPDKNPFGAFTLGEKSLGRTTDARGLRMVLADCLANQKWLRSLFLNTELQPRKPGEGAAFQICLSPHGWGLWRALEWPSEPPYGNWYESAWVFPTVPANELARIGAEEILSRIFSISDETADFRFAREFLKLSPAEQEAHIWKWKRGDLAQLQSVLHLALLAQEELWREPRTIRWEVDLAQSEDDGLKRGLVKEKGATSQAPICLEESFQRVLDWFGFEILHEAHKRHLCLTQLYKDKCYRGELTVEVEADNPTAHERIEAMMELRAWLEETRVAEV